MSASTVPADLKPRDHSFDAFRGIAIVLVVLAHAGVYGWSFQHQPGGAFNFWFCIFLRNFALWSLPVFLFISGYFLATIPMRTWDDYRDFLRRRLLRVVVPYLVWSLAVATLSWVRADPGSEHARLALIPWKVLTGTADGSYFFILLMIQFYVLAPVMLWLSATNRRILLTLATHALIIALAYLLRAYWWPDMPYEVIKTPFLGWLAIFPAGMYARRNPHVLTATPFFVALSLFLLCYTAAILETALLLPFAFEFAISDIRFPPMLMGFAILAVLMHLRPWPWPSWLWTLGEYSFGIFFVHGVIVRFFVKVLLVVAPGLHTYFPIFDLVLGGLSLALSCAIIWAGRRALGRDRASRWLGF